MSPHFAGIRAQARGPPAAGLPRGWPDGYLKTTLKRPTMRVSVAIGAGTVPG
jgi:hypothetical protein